MPKEMTLHGQTRTDDYFWLRNKESSEVLDHLKRENEFTEQHMAPTKELQQKLFQELKGRVKETDLSVPVKHGDFYYYSRTVEGQQYSIHCRKKGSLDAQEEILLDENEMAKGKEYFALGTYDPSPDHRLIAYTTDYDGSEVYTLRIKDTVSGQTLPDIITKATTNLEWAQDNKTLFYTRMDKTMRPHQLWRHTLGQKPDQDKMVFQEDDEAFYLGISQTRSREYLILHLGSISSDEVHFLKSDSPEQEFTLIQARQKGLEYSVDHHGQHFYIVTNHQARNFRLVKADVSDPAMSKWQEVVAHREAVKVEDTDMFSGHMVLHLREEGMTTMHVFDMNSGAQHRIKFKEPVYAVWSGENAEFKSTVFRLVFSSLITPETVYDYDLDKRTLELKKQYEVLGGYKPENYLSERIQAQAPDGTSIPISLLMRKDFPKDGSRPAQLRAYGSYGYSYEPTFDSDRLSLVDRGFVVAIAHVRGGGELGRPWYENGKLLHKRNTFTDFIACAEHLIAQKYTSPAGLTIGGGSAGGLLIGAVLNMRPDLFAVAIADVPFVDVINTMLDTSLPLVVIEYEEWGNPQVEEFYKYMMSYSPYDQVKQQAYPHMLVTAGLNDPRVQYWEPAKWVARLRANKTDDNLLLLKTKMEAGHFGASGRYEVMRETAFEYAFILDRLGLRQ